MRRWAALAVLACVGCSNAPLAGFLDAVRPSRARPAIDPAPTDGLDARTPDGGSRLLPPQFTPPTLPDAAPPPIQPTTPPANGGIGPLRLPNT